jgi:diaminopimelate epimerase
LLKKVYYLDETGSMKLRFTKMHGLGNDFVMIDAISQKVSITPDRAKKLADRHFGIGCDQVLVVEPPTSSAADFRYRIFNNDGSEVENCGNGARCFAVFVRMRKLTGKHEIRAETAGGNLVLQVLGDNQVTVNMGIPRLEPDAIPFHATQRAVTYPLQLPGQILEISAISMGNPHAVTFVDNLSQLKLNELGPLIEHHCAFPKRVNAGFIEVLSRNEAQVRVFERGAGETLACGTGACAAVVAGRLRGLLDTSVQVKLPGGSLMIEWAGEGHPVMMTGPATTVFHGQITI